VPTSVETLNFEETTEFAAEKMLLVNVELKVVKARSAETRILAPGVSGILDVTNIIKCLLSLEGPILGV
jgi:hypothetical protein